MGGEARRASLCSCLFLGSVGLWPKCSWRIKLLPRKAVLPAAHCVEEPARCTRVCLCVFSVCVSETEKSAENMNEKSFLHRVQETLETVHKGINFDLRLAPAYLKCGQVVLMYSQAPALLLQTLCPSSPTPAPLSCVCIVMLRCQQRAHSSHSKRGRQSLTCLVCLPMDPCF